MLNQYSKSERLDPPDVPVPPKAPPSESGRPDRSRQTRTVGRPGQTSSEGKFARADVTTVEQWTKAAGLDVQLPALSKNWRWYVYKLCLSWMDMAVGVDTENAFWSIP